MTVDLSGRIALVTGGSSGIGRATSMLLAAANARVIINYEKSRESAAQEVRGEIVRDGHEADIFQADISNPEEVNRMFEYINDKFGRLDVLVNNAGIVRDNLLLTMKLSDWDKVHDVNLSGAFLCTKYAAEIMMRNGSGKVINVASVTAVRGSGRLSSYASAKGGLIAFTKACAVELAKKRIQVNAVLPGIVPTDLSKRAIKRAGKNILGRTPAARFGEPVEIANLIVFLASDRADYITGQAIPVDGGLSIS